MLGSDPPDKATVNLPFLSIDSFWALMTNSARDEVRTSFVGKEQTTGGWREFGCMVVVVANVR